MKSRSQTGAAARGTLALSLWGRDRYAEAVRLVQTAHATLRGLVGEADPETTIGKGALADAQRRKDRWVEEELHHRRRSGHNGPRFPTGKSGKQFCWKPAGLSSPAAPESNPRHRGSSMGGQNRKSPPPNGGPVNLGWGGAPNRPWGHTLTGAPPGLWRNSSW